ncbi:uncharacterized protein EAF01_003024 [Botrytis porri]|uniref:uncharacterized protein n=1 Tax=Botrytis porri TaxID=87229 RepID=UPI0018FFF9E0|nr:uncharacterized protein EAF01_003024 [Botrytis porri]KAF7909306.1 hypothetical protein EAF01_003024 [Botrytis porri]
MYLGDSFGELEVQAAAHWKKGQKQWWSMDNITDERSIERKRRVSGEMEVGHFARSIPTNTKTSNSARPGVILQIRR